VRSAPAARSDSRLLRERTERESRRGRSTGRAASRASRRRIQRSARARGTVPVVGEEPRPGTRA